MPQNINDFIWYFGIGTIVALVGMVAFFLVRLIDGIDSFKRDVSKQFDKLNRTMEKIDTDLQHDINRVKDNANDIDRRVVALETVCNPTCINYGRRANDDKH